MWPENAEVTARLFNVYARTNQLEKAMAIAESEVEREPDNAQHWYNYGSLLLEAERYDDAIMALEKSIEIEPDNISGLFNLGAAYQNKGVDLNDEVSTLDEEIRGGELSEEDAAAAQEKMEATAAQRDDLFGKSLEPLTKARSMAEATGEDVTGICTALGQAYARTNDMEKASEAYECAEGTTPDAEGN